MKPAYLLIDFENVQPNIVGAVETGAFKVKVFVGAKQPRMQIDMASALQPLGKAVEYIRIEGSGRNALDLHIAYYIGRLAVEEPGTIFHIVSKDTDYDPLIDHLKKQKIACHRWSSVADIPGVRAAPAKPAQAPKPARRQPAKRTAAATPAPPPPPKHGRVDDVVTNLRKRHPALPASLKSLASTIKERFKRERLSEAEIAEIIGILKDRGLIDVKADKVTYALGS